MRERDESAKAQLKVRVPEPVRAAIEAAAERRGASLNDEIVRRLEHSLRADAEAGGPQTAAVVAVIASALRMIEATAGYWRAGDDAKAVWLRDPWVFDQAVRAVNKVLEVHRPAGEPMPPPPPGMLKSFIGSAEQKKKYVDEIGANVARYVLEKEQSK